MSCSVFFVSQFSRAEPDSSILRSPVVQTESGAVVGKIEAVTHGETVYEYLGIPYAEPPVGELRFAAPKPAKPWSGSKEATEFGAECPQTAVPIPGLVLTEKDEKNEDCLFLNVFVPSSTKPNDTKAVMVWIHGGGFQYGSSNIYRGGVLAAFNDVIIVTLNYRLGVLGFINAPGTDVKGNYGMLDQVLALKWVQNNIANFGGDPNKVTIFGESAGGVSVSLHLISPLSKGLFQRAIMHSGVSSMPSFSGKVIKPIQLEWYAKRINCSLGSDIVECVRSKSVEDIVSVQSLFLLERYIGPQDIIGPIVDGEFLPDLPVNLFETGKFHDVDVISGVASNEGALFAMMMPPDLVKDGVERTVFESFVRYELFYSDFQGKSPLIEDLIIFQYSDHADPLNKTAIRQSLMDCASDAMFVAPAIKEAKALAKAGRLPRVYVFDHRPTFARTPEWMGVIHGIDIAFTFGFAFMEKTRLSPIRETFLENFTEIEKGFSLQVMKMFTDFAKYGTPNPPESGPAAVTWPHFTMEEQEYLVLDVKPRVKRRYKAENMAFWNEMISKVSKFLNQKGEEIFQKAAKDEL